MAVASLARGRGLFFLTVPYIIFVFVNFESSQISARFNGNIYNSNMFIYSMEYIIYNK